MVQELKLVNINATVLGSIPCRGSVKIFPFSRSGNEAKRGVEFRQSTHNALRTR